jgi:hypothetical protein
MEGGTMKIGPHNVKIISDQKTDRRLLDDGHYGDSDLERLRIHVRTDLAPSVWHETVLHEILHHVWALTSLKERYSSDQEEEVIRAISPYLHQIVGPLVKR